MTDVVLIAQPEPRGAWSRALPPPSTPAVHVTGAPVLPSALLAPTRPLRGAPAPVAVSARTQRAQRRTRRRSRRRDALELFLVAAVVGAGSALAALLAFVLVGGEM